MCVCGVCVVDELLFNYLCESEGISNNLSTE